MISLTGKDTIILGTRVMKDFATGDTGSLDFPNNVGEIKQGKNGNTIIAYNASGSQCTATLRLMRGSPDDKYLASELRSFKNDPAAYVLMAGEFIKRVGDGAGNITNDVYTFSGGFVQKMPVVKENVEGDTEQAVCIYTLVFTNGDRIMG